MCVCVSVHHHMNSVCFVLELVEDKVFEQDKVFFHPTINVLVKSSFFALSFGMYFCVYVRLVCVLVCVCKTVVAWCLHVI